VRVVAVRFSKDDGFAILRVVPVGEDIPFSAVGKLAHLADGDFAHLEGAWLHNPRHGRELKVTVATPIDPPTADAMLGFLARLPGIGKMSAERLLASYGDRLFEHLDADAQRVFGALPRVGSKAAAKAAAAYGERRSEKDLWVLLEPEGLTGHTRALVARHGPQAARVVRENPYVLMAQPGVAFRKADALARRCGVARDDDRRLEAALIAALVKAEDDGHTRAQASVILAAATRLAQVPVRQDRLDALEQRKQVIVDDQGWVARRALDRSERLFAASVARLLTAQPRHRVRVPEAPVGNLTGEQWTAVRRAFDCGFSVVAGRPGTGKTTLVRAIVAIAQHRELDIALAAPTGAAARRLEQATGASADTVHGLLGWGRGERGDGPSRDASDPLKIDLLVVDETSMLGQTVASHLLDAVEDGTRVIFVGDRNQLPAVDAGNVLDDLIRSGAVPVTELTEPQRQAKRSMIVRALHSMLDGYYPATDVLPGEDVEPDFFVVAADDLAHCQREVADLVCERLPSYYDLDPLRDFMVLSPTKQGPVGVDALNEILSQRLNPAGAPIPGRGAKVRIGDRAVFTRKNVKDLGLMNGTRLIIEAHDPKKGVIATDDTENRVVTIPPEYVKYLMPAFAMTVHRAQGQEAPVVVTVVHRQLQAGDKATYEGLLTLENVYTAVSRGRQVSLIVGEPLAFAQAIARRGTGTRNTALRERLIIAGRS
jgi:exodeoxyribonuclease V alpha subunit